MLAALAWLLLLSLACSDRSSGPVTETCPAGSSGCASGLVPNGSNPVDVEGGLEDCTAACASDVHKGPGFQQLVYMANYWTPSSPSTVYVLSNCEEVELFVNGGSAGRIRPNLYPNLPHPIFEFQNVGFVPGELTAVGYIDGAEAANSTRRTPGNPTRLVLAPDYTRLVADGSDMTSVTITAVDANGQRVPYASDTVNIAVSGPGKFIGEQSVALEGGRISFLVQSIHEPPGGRV